MFLARGWARAGAALLPAARGYKLFADSENRFAYETLAASGRLRRPERAPAAQPAPPASELPGGLDAFLRRDWRRASPQELCDAFRLLAAHSSRANQCISDAKFDEFIDSLTDTVRDASDERLRDLFLDLALWPETESVRTRNFIEVWAALDDACLARFKNWSFDEMLTFAALTFNLNIAKSCEYTLKCVRRLAGRAKNLTPEQLVQTYFYMGVLRKAPLNKHDMELKLQSDLSKFTIDEVAIIAMGLFKSKTPMRNMELMSRIIEKTIAEADEINEVSLAAILKLVRYSMKNANDGIIRRLLSAMEAQVPRLSLMCCVHVALLGTATLTLHKSCLTRVAERVASDMPAARLKDLERLTLTFATFDFHPPTVKFFELVIEELRKHERLKEIEKYGRSFASCVWYLTLLGYYPADQMGKTLDPEFINRTYSNQPYLMGREILAIDNAVEIHLDGYNGNRLGPKVTKLLSRKYTDYVPDEDFQCEYNVSERMVLDIISILRKMRGGKSFVYGDHALTHFQRGDIFICNDSNGNPVDISSHLPFKPFGIVQRVPSEDTWIALVIAARNAFIKDTLDITGPFKTKSRELQKIGYHPAIVPWYVWVKLNSEEEKIEYIQGLINNAVKT